MTGANFKMMLLKKKDSSVMACLSVADHIVWNSHGIQITTVLGC